MKRILFLAPVLAISIQCDYVAAQVLTEPWHVTERTANARAWESVNRITDVQTGRIREEKQRYMEIASGLHFNSELGWTETLELFLPALDGGVEATHGPHRVHINANLNTVAAVNFQGSNNKRLRANIVGLSLFNPLTQEAITISHVKDCIGQLVPPNQIVFRDAFRGGPKADVIYIYLKPSG